MLIPSRAERGEDLGRDAGVRLHARADDGHLAHRRVVVDGADAHLAATGSSASRATRTSARGTVNDMSAAAPSDSGSFWMIMSTLTLASASAVKMRPGDAGMVGHAEQRDARLVGGVRHGGDQGAFHRLLFSDHEGPGRLGERRAAVDAHAVRARVLDGAQLQHAGAGGGHLEHLLEGDDRAACAHSRRCADRPSSTPGHVRVDLAHVRLHGGGEGDRRGVRPAAAQRRDVARGGDALEAGHEHDQVLLERLADAVGAHVEDARLRVRRVRDDAGLRARERDRPVPEVVDGHRAQRARDPLARGEEHVHLARVGRGGDLLGGGDQLVRGLAARRQHGDHVVALLLGAHDAPGGALDALGVGDGGAAELHHHGAGHGQPV